MTLADAVLAAMRWAGDPPPCPNCGAQNYVGIMSLAATCPCGYYWVDVRDGKGWYTSRESYMRGEKPIIGETNA